MMLATVHIMWHNHGMCAACMYVVPGLRFGPRNAFCAFRTRDTALILAAKKGHVEMFKLLLEAEDIDVNAKANNGYGTGHVGGTAHSVGGMR